MQRRWEGCNRVQLFSRNRLEALVDAELGTSDAIKAVKIAAEPVDDVAAEVAAPIAASAVEEHRAQTGARNYTCRLPAMRHQHTSPYIPKHTSCVYELPWKLLRSCK